MRSQTKTKRQREFTVHSSLALSRRVVLRQSEMVGGASRLSAQTGGALFPLPHFHEFPRIFIIFTFKEISALNTHFLSGKNFCGNITIFQ